VLQLANGIGISAEAMSAPLERNGMLHIVTSNGGQTQRLTLAARHIETAISHINDVAQSRVPTTTAACERCAEVDELRLIVRALADIRDALQVPEWAGH
jgi:hypothetical protein